MTISLGSFVHHVDKLEELEKLVEVMRKPGQKRIATDIIMMSDQHSSENLKGPVRFVHETSGVVVELDLAALFNHIINAQENA